MSEIQDPAQVTLTLIGGYHLGFDPNGVLHQAVYGFRSSPQDVVALLDHVMEQSRIANDTLLDDFVQAGAVFALGNESSTPESARRPEW